MRGALAIVLLLLGAWWLWPQRPERLPPASQPVELAEEREAPVVEVAPVPPSPETAEREHDGERALVAAADASLPATVTVRGRVLLGNGDAASGASVHAGRHSTTTRIDGTFVLQVDGSGVDLVAWLEGQQPAVVADVAQRPEVVAGRTLDVVLPGPPLTIDGWLRLADGRPAVGWKLMLHSGGLDVGHGGLPRATAEDLAIAGRATWDERGEPNVGSMRGNGGHPNVRTIGEDGAFEVRGLRAGASYGLRAWNESTLQTVLSPPILAGTRGYVFVVPEGRWRERVRGRAIDRHGAALEGVRVRLTMRVHVDGGSESYQTGQEVRTDAAGRFEFARVPHQDLLLRFNRNGLASHYHELPAEAVADDLLIRLDRL